MNSDHGIEIKIPLSAFAGVHVSQTLQLFALITSAAGYISNECIPGELGSSNLGNDANLGSVGTQDLFTTALPLPGELMSFDVVVKGSSAILKWKTVSEQNNAGFEVQK